MRSINTIENMLIVFLRAGICGGEIDEATKDNLTEENLVKLYNLAQKHDLAHVVADVLFKQKLMPDYEIGEFYKSNILMAVFRYQKSNYELQRICGLFEENEIAHMPLKGAVLCKYYSEPWMRTSCDIDILVKPQDLQRAADLLIDKLNYQSSYKGSHDWSFISENGVHIELHYNLIEQSRIYKNQPRHKWNTNVLNDIWLYSTLADNKNYEYKMYDEMLYYYHIAHMAKHFEKGGCGIRPFIDLWILNVKCGYDRSSLEQMLIDSGLLRFESVVKTLSDVWFCGEERNNVTAKVENYILTGGVYGNMENLIAVQQNKSGSMFKYVISRIFVPYEILKFRYPILQKHKWLLPMCHIHRWYKRVFFRGMNKSVRELTMLSEEQIKNTKDVLDNLGL